ncbi:MAG: class I SAM-dependent methyltransferase [Planctomycetes bacterium]|nr:class I SAM-dependent methyltransferase [Planctomycetota bacterium]MCH9776694.1 class I SAM-dependent methyltransferase [Planctomycetota bacterium]
MRAEPTYQIDYIQGYDKNNSDKTLGGYFLKKSHILLEKNVPKLENIEIILEVGAGSGHHFPHVKKTFSKYIMTDGSQEMLALAREKYPDEISAGLIELEEQDATSLTYADNSVDRLIATHVLEHLLNPVDVLKEWNRVVRPGGLISIALPCDPGMLWRFGRHLGPRRNAKKLGLNYDYLQAAEHVNAINNLVVFMRHHFEFLTESWYPLLVPMPDLNLFYICHVRTTE